MTQDDRRFEELIEESQDIQVDSMRSARQGLADLVEVGQASRADGIEPEEVREATEERSRLISASVKAGGVLAFGGIGAALLKLFSAPAFAAQSIDVQALQTSASIEHLAVATYGKALTLPFIGGSSANPVIKKFAMVTMQQHAQHAVAFNDTAVKLGGKVQPNPDPVLAPKVASMVPSLTDATKVVALAATLERVASETYNKNCMIMTEPSARLVMSSILGIDSQHLATLLAVQALLPTPDLIAIPTDVAKLPSAAGSAGFPDTFLPTNPAYARPPSEGAVS